MKDEKERPIDESYELIDEELGPLDGFGENDFERWLRVGLEGYLLEDRGAWAFPESAGTIASQDHLVDGLRDVYSELPANGRACFRRAVANLLASLEAREENVPLFEHLLSLAMLLPVPEVLRVLPARIGNGFFGLTDNREGESLFALTLLAATGLAAPRQESVRCLNSLIGSRHFDHAYSGIALTALCRADHEHFVDHMALLRKSMAKMFSEFRTAIKTKRALALDVINAIGLHELIGGLPRLLYFDPRDQDTPVDTWFIDALLDGRSAPLEWEENQDGNLFFRCRRKPELEVILPSEGPSLFDLFNVLRDKQRKHSTAKAKNQISSDQPDRGRQLAGYFEYQNSGVKPCPKQTPVGSPR